MHLFIDHQAHNSSQNPGNFHFLEDISSSRYIILSVLPGQSKPDIRLMIIMLPSFDSRRLLGLDVPGSFSLCHT